MTELYVGVMSGTSLDGADAVLVDLTDGSIGLIAQHHQPFPPALRAELEQLITTNTTSTQTLAALDRRLGLFYAEAVSTLLQTAGRTDDEIRAIGNHGQTVFHDPDGAYPATLQLGDPSSVAAATGITTVGHFRQLDIAHGGQGAPLACAFHARFLSAPGETRAVVNVGGIANVTLLPPDGPVLGFDTGPGNTLLDGWHRRHQGGDYDANGAWAASGRVNRDLLARLLAEPYFSRPAPKSTGRELFHLDWLEQALQDFPAVNAQDVQATLAELTAATIAAALPQGGVARLLVCGGGAHNADLRTRLAAHLTGIPVETTDSHGIPADWLEAMAFAWLAWARLHDACGNLPSVTGARQPAILGGVYLS